MSNAISASNTIDNDKARDFWQKNAFMKKITWAEFLDAYIDYMNQQPFSREFLRGAKVLICEENSDIVSVSSFDCAIKYAGFPFDQKRIIGIEKWRTFEEDEKTIEEFGALSMSPETLQKELVQYIDMLLDQHLIFVDSITCELLNIDDNCVPIQVAETNVYDNVDDIPMQDVNIIYDAVGYFTTLDDEKVNKILLTGKPASGKSTLLKMILLRLASLAKSKLEQNNKDFLVP